MGKTKKDRRDIDYYEDSSSRRGKKRFKKNRRNRERDLGEYKNVPSSEILQDFVDGDG